MATDNDYSKLSAKFGLPPRKPWEVSTPGVNDPKVGQAPAGPMPQIITGARLFEMDLPPQRWLVPNILPFGYTVFGATSKFGKSWLMYDLCLAVTEGDRLFLGEVAERGVVLYLALEDSHTRSKSRMATLLGEGRTASPDLHLSIEWPRLDEGGMEWIEHWVSMNRDPHNCRSCTVIIDTAAAIRPLSGGGNFYEADSLFHGAFLDLARRWEIAVMVVTHTTKGKRDDPFESIMGTMGVLGKSDAAWVGQREWGEDEATLHFTGRDVRCDSMALEFADGKWTSLGDAARVRVNQTEKAIMDILRVSPGMSPSEVAAVAMMPLGTAKRAMWQMSNKEPPLLHAEKGKYRLS
jgi:hypothetical protein